MSWSWLCRHACVWRRCSSRSSGGGCACASRKAAGGSGDTGCPAQGRDNAGAGSAAGVSVPDPSAGAKRVCGPAIRSTRCGRDVYKRQVVGCPDENRFGFCQIRLALEWFEANLKGTAQEENGGMIDAYVMGEGWKRWNGADIPATSVRTLYLKHGADGVHHELKRDAAFKEEHLSYRYDPENPVMSCGGKLLTNYQKDGAEPECTALCPSRFRGQ